MSQSLVDERGQPMTHEQAYALWLANLKTLARQPDLKQDPVVVMLPMPMFKRGCDLPPQELCVQA